MMPHEKFRNYVTLLELIPPMPTDKATWKKGISEAQQYLMSRECQGVIPDTVPFIAIIDYYIRRLEKAKAMLSDGRFTSVYRGQSNTNPDLLDFEMLPGELNDKSGEGNAAKSK